MEKVSSDVYGCVAFDFKPSVSDELELQIGNIVKVLKEIDQFWYFGQSLHDGKSGQFPKEFVNIITLPQAKPGETLMFALDSFFPEVKDDLPFKKGDIIVMSHQVDESWGYGECENKHGIFPLNYTQKLPISKLAGVSAKLDIKTLCTVTATMPLSAQLDEELSFEIGDVIEVSEIMQDGWAIGRIGNQSGTFPLSFTSYEQSVSSKTLTNVASPAIHHAENTFNQGNAFPQITDDAVRASSRAALNTGCSEHLTSFEKPQPILSVHEQLLTESVAGCSSTLVTAERIDKSSTKNHSSISSGSDSGYGSFNVKDPALEKPSNAATTMRMVIANYSHFSRNPDELSFKEGDVIEVLEVKSDMWLFGKLRGSTGYVPENYVSDYVVSRNGHNELTNVNILFEKMKDIQQHGTSPQREHATKALTNIMRQHDDVRLVVHDFQASTDFELSLDVGSIVHVLQEINEKWCEVKNNRGNIGFVPYSCLEHVKARTSTNHNTKPAASVQRSQAFIAKKSPLIESNNKKLSRAVSCQPVITHSEAASTDDSSPNIQCNPGSGDTAGITPSNSASSFRVKGRRHSYHNREVTNQRAVTRNRGSSEKHREIKVEKAPSEKSNETNSKIARLSESSSVNRSKRSENDSSSVTSRDSVHSNNVPSSSCSTDSSENTSKLKSSSSRSSVLSSESSGETKGRRISRTAPPPPTKKIERVSTPVTERAAALHEQSPPVRPPMPDLKPEEAKLNSAERKTKIEKVRSEIEEYSRMQKSLEDMYNSTFDGKVRQEISEDKQFVVVKLKRLQKELRNLITFDSAETRDSFESLPQNTSNDSTATISVPAVQDHIPVKEEIADIKEKRSVKRNHVIRELIKTEEDYLQDVVITINDIMKPLFEREIPLDIKLDIIFGNIEEIRDFSKDLLTSLKRTDKENTDIPVSVGSVFIKHSSRMKEVYKIYCRNHDDATALLEKYDDDPEFQVPVQEYLNHVKNKVNTFDLGSFLIKPVQRILKYPLLLQELLKLADIPGPGEDRGEYDDLIEAVKLLQEAANDINEDKRRKDLVRKYRKGSQDANLVGKFSRISLRSVRKKSARNFLRLGHVTGFNQPETVDETFNSLEKRFRDLEKSIKMFLQNSDNFGNRYRDLLSLEKLLLEHFTDVWASDHTTMIETYGTSMRRIADHLYRQFHNRTQLEVNTPLNALLLQFKGPQALIDKRFDKLLDYENSQKGSDPKDKTQMAKNVYEALNHQLIDELPALCNLGYKLLDASISLFLSLQIRFLRNMLEVTEPVLALCVDKLLASELDKKSIMEKFNAAKNQAMVEMRSSSIIPSSFAAVSLSFHGGHASPSTNRAMSSKQSQAHKEALQNKYAESDLYVITTTYKSDDKMSLSVCAGDLVGAIKRQDPLGSSTRWYCDDGGAQGFLPSKILKSYSSQLKTSLTAKGSKNATKENPTPQFQRKSPTPSSLSSGSNEKNSPLPNSSVRPTSKPAKFTKTTSVEKHEVLPENKSHPLIDPNKMRMRAYWDRKKMTDRQKFRLDFQFLARSTLELTVREGELVELVEEHDMDGNSEWWLVANADGKQGYVPANYMSKIEYL